MSASAELIKRAAVPVTVWLVGRLVERPRVRRTLRRVDRHLAGAAIRSRKMTPRRVWRVMFGVGVMMVGAMIIVRSRPETAGT